MLRYGQGHIALVALGLAVGTLSYAGAEVSTAMLMLVGAGAWAAYVGERLIVAAPEDALHRSGRVAWFEEHRAQLWMALVACAGAVAVSLMHLAWAARAVAAATALVGAGYAAWPALRAHPVGKPAAIALAWTLGGVLLPLSAGTPGTGLTAPLLCYVGARTATVAANVVLCDWPDRYADAVGRRRTMATSLNPWRVRSVAAALAGAALLLDVAALAPAAGVRHGWVMIGPLGLLAACVWLPKPGAAPRMALDLLVGAGGLSGLG